MSGNATRIVAWVGGAAALVFGVWEVRVWTAHKAGKVPKTLSAEWQAAQDQRMGGGMELQADPDAMVYLNPHRHSVPASVGIRHATAH